MPHRSPARWLAPIALVAAALAVVVIANPSSDSPSGSSAAPATSTAATTARTTPRRRRSTSRTYTVKPGDVLSSIAEKTGVSLQRLQELNPDVDASALRAGQKLKLAPAS